MPRVLAKRDNLDQRNAEFRQVPLEQSVFLNSVPKSGTHLMRNIFRMFVPVAQHYPDVFIQYPILRQHQVAFSPSDPKLSWGHLLFSDDSAIALTHAKHVLLVRDPYDWVLARARFFFSDNFQGSLEHLKGGAVNAAQMLNMMIFGIHKKAPSLNEIYTHNAVSWLGTGIILVRFEELLMHARSPHTEAAEAFFGSLFDDCGIALPEDWARRVEIGADRGQSGTARENLSDGAAVDLPDELPEPQRRLVDYAAPGLRALLGYE